MEKTIFEGQNEDQPQEAKPGMMHETRAVKVRTTIWNVRTVSTEELPEAKQRIKMRIHKKFRGDSKKISDGSGTSRVATVKTMIKQDQLKTMRATVPTTWTWILLRAVSLSASQLGVEQDHCNISSLPPPPRQGAAAHPRLHHQGQESCREGERKTVAPTTTKAAPVVIIPLHENEGDQFATNGLSVVNFHAVASNLSHLKPVSLESPCGTL